MRMTRIGRIIEMLQPYSQQEAIDALNKKIDQLGYEGVSVTDVEFDFENDIYVTFKDDDGYMTTVFLYDEFEEEFSIVIEPEDEYDDFEDVAYIDITPMNPPLFKCEMGLFIDLVTLDWFNKTLLESILIAGDMEADEIQIFDHETNERKKYVIRGGKKVRIPLVRKKRRKRLTAKQRQGIRKASIKRRSKKGQIARKRKKSMRLRKRTNLKRGGTPKGYKVQGTKGYR